MSAAPKRNPSLGLDSLDAEARKAARQAARHAGMSLDEWLAAVSANKAAEAGAAQSRKAQKRKRPEQSDELDAAVAKLQAVADLARKPAGIAAEELEGLLARAAEATERRSREQAAKTAAALGSVASWIERAEDRLSAASRNAAERQEHTTAVLGDALATMTARLDEIERKLSDGGRPSLEAALKAIERIESQLAKANDKPEKGANAAIETVLRGFETRIAEITDRLAERPPAGPRRPAEIRSAVAEIRARQAELDRTPEPADAADAPPPRAARAPAPRPPADVLHSLRDDIARLASQLDTLRPGAGGSAEVAGLRGEIERLQTMVGGLATRDEINALERALRGITAQVANARAPGDLAAVSRPVEELEAEIGRVAELVTSGVHGRLSREFETLARRIEAISGSGIDPEVIDGLAQQLLDVRRLLSDMAEPRRVQQLAAQFAELNERLTEIGRRQLDAREFERRFDGLARKLDSLGGDVPPQASGDIAERIDALSQKLDRLSEKPRITVGGPPAEGLDSLVQRLDRLDEALTRGGPAPQLKPIEDMLRTLVARIDQAERPGAGADSLDALEKQVAILARRLERGSGDPALSALERTMGDLMAQVELMRTGAYEAAERAAKTAVADTLATLPKPEPEPQIGLLRRDLDDLRSSRNGADERVQSTLESVHAALEKVVARLGSLDGEPSHAEPPARTPAERPPTPRIKAQAPTPRNGASAPAASPGEAPAVVLSEADQPILPASLEEILLEPGAARPRPGATGANPDANLDVKASFIAAARRAAQAAAAEAAANAKVKGRGGARESSLASRVEGAKDGLAARMKGAFSKHRRPLLLGLAAIVLALGAFQTLGTLGLFSEAPPAKAPAVKSEARIAAPAPAPAPAMDPVEAVPSQLAEPAPKVEEPKTTQAISSPAPQRSEIVAPASKPEERAAAATPGRFEPKAPVMSLPAGFTPLQITPAAPATIGAIDPRPAATPIANVAAVGEIPSAQGLGGLRQAALAGDPVAVYDLAARLAEGRGVTRDLKLAAKLFEKAAANGVVPAQYRIGNQYEKGLGVTRDLALAKGWYERAAEKGNARAMHNLAVLLAEGGSDRKPDYAAAAESFRKAAEHGVKDSQYNLAVLLARGLGVSQNLARSYTWFAIVAAQGDEDAGRKRDEVGARLSAADLAAAKAAAESFKPAMPIREANEVALPANGWPEPVAAPAAKPPASAHRPGGAGKRV
jgi:localization factor PodJL